MVQTFQNGVDLVMFLHKVLEAFYVFKEKSLIFDVVITILKESSSYLWKVMLHGAETSRVFHVSPVYSVGYCSRCLV